MPRLILQSLAENSLLYKAGVWLITSRTFCASCPGENGFCKNANPFSSIPPLVITFSV